MQGETDLVITKKELKGPHFKHMHIDKEAPMGHHYTKNIHFSWEIGMTESLSEVPIQ